MTVRGPMARGSTYQTQHACVTYVFLAGPWITRMTPGTGVVCARVWTRAAVRQLDRMVADL
jgi:hypothetical protein